MEDFIKNHITYHKINTLYKRDEKTHRIIIGDFSIPEFDYLYDNLWSCEEKIDGTNVHCFWNGTDLEFHGKTENAEMRKSVLDRMKEVFTVEKLKTIFPEKYDESGNIIYTEVRIYCEAFGKGIQKGGNYKSNGVDIIVFDVNINRWWLERKNVEDVAQKLNIQATPLIGIMTLGEAEEVAKHGFKSRIAENKDYDAEGLVCKPLYNLSDRGGRRIVCKIKTVDYKKLK